MPDILHAADEETDVGSYQAYLRAQSDADLLDITRNLSAELYPARLDAARREAMRRRVLPASVDTPTESNLRAVAVAAFVFTFLTLTLAALLTPAEARDPSWPTVEMIPEGTTLSQIARMFSLSLLRGIVVWSVKLGVVFVLLLASLWGISARRIVKKEVRYLSLVALLGLFLAAIAAAFSPVSLLF